jgi:hypothetical protein
MKALLIGSTRISRTLHFLSLATQGHYCFKDPDYQHYLAMTAQQLINDSDQR